MNDSYFEWMIDTGVKEELIKTGITKKFLEEFLEYVNRDMYDDIKYFNDYSLFLEDKNRADTIKSYIVAYNKDYDNAKSYIYKNFSTLNELEIDYLIELCDIIGTFQAIIKYANGDIRYNMKY